MAVKEKSFWSTTSGVVTGVAGTLTGVVGMVTLAAQMGWIGGDGGNGGTSNDPANVQAGNGAVTTPAPAGNRGSGSGGSSSANATPTFSVDPTSLTFESLGSRQATVKVVNDGSVPVTVQSPKVEGSNSSQFSATAPTCTARDLTPGRSCEVQVTFAPTRTGNYKATLVIQVAGARAQEVALSGQSLL
jgi:hypothetical protein